MVQSPIDIVVTWVDGNDSKWQQEKQSYKVQNNYSESNTTQRYRQLSFFNYWFRAVEQYAPWVNKIFLVTYGHLPEWLDTSHPKLRIVKHEEFIPKEYLPTYNSNAIELNLHRINDLSEQFIIFNDDVLLNAKVKPEDFFIDGKVKSLGIYAPIVPREEFNHIELNNAIIINKNFNIKHSLKNSPMKFFNLKYGKYIVNNILAVFYNGVLGYKNTHICLPHLKSTFQEVWEKESDILNKTCLNRFRDISDVNHYLMNNWDIEQNRFEPQNIDFGAYYSLGNISKLQEEIMLGKHKVICINDDIDDINFEEKIKQILEIYLEKFPNKSLYEK